jgi:hypothetical protein
VKKRKLLAMSLAMVMSVLLFSGCAVTVGVPEVKEARFDISVTYEINGEQKTYTGIYVCEYDGVETTFLGSSIEWKGCIENEEEFWDMPIQTNEDGIVYLNFGLFPEYFMGDPNAMYYEEPSPSLYMIYNDSNEEMTHSTGEEEEILRYGVKLISYEYAAPIENTFTEKLTFSRFVPSIN